ncbi:MAG TPA: hypothetical protein VFC46_11245 [Humisphaera sp.]|nr:hypothetical protein [Humisphaera sp.]
MPQETKGRPYDVEQHAANGVGVVHENFHSANISFPFLHTFG